jgi:hypothetical protein
MESKAVAIRELAAVTHKKYLVGNVGMSLYYALDLCH